MSIVIAIMAGLGVWIGSVLALLGLFAVRPDFVVECLLGDSQVGDSDMLIVNTCILYTLAAPLTILLILVILLEKLVGLLPKMIRLLFFAAGSVVTKLTTKKK